MIEGIIKSGELNYCDFFTYHRPHAYGYYELEGGSIMPEEMSPHTWTDEINTFKEWFEDYGPRELDIWNTEFRQWVGTGYLDKERFAQFNTSQGGAPVVDTETSVDWVVRGQVVSMANGVSKLFVYGVSPTGWNYDMTSVQYMKEPDGRPKPWMMSYAAMTHMLEGYKPAGQVELHPRIRCYLFEKDRTTTAVLWGLHTKVNELNKPGPGDVELQAKAKLYDIMANELEASNDGAILAPLVQSPYYLVFDKTTPKEAAEILKTGQIRWHSIH